MPGGSSRSTGSWTGSRPRCGGSSIAVWAERSHELYGEFQARFDLIREGRWLDAMNARSTGADFTGHGACRPRQAYQKLQPIPNKELAANPMMQQNTGY